MHYSQTLSHLNFTAHCYHVFKPAPIVAYRRSGDLSDFLVRTQTSQSHTTQPTPGLIPMWKKNSFTRKYISDGQTLYTFHSTGETRPITHHIDCNCKNVIYMVQCNHCFKQYIVQSTTPNPPQSQNISLLMINPLTTSHLYSTRTH